MKTPILGKSAQEIEQVLAQIGIGSSYVFDFTKSLYKRNISNLLEIKSFPISIRKALASNIIIGKYPPLFISVSSDGAKKYLFENEKGQRFETVYIPGKKRNTLCISTQSGCRMGCSFCLTGKLGFNDNLTSLDIVNQLYSIPEWNKINRIVIMGMGEPFDNYEEVEKAISVLITQGGLSFGASNITISTIGIKDKLNRFLQRPFCNLAISLHSPFHDERKKVMPIENSSPIADIIECIKANPIKKPLRLSFEYVVLGGINTSEEHAKAIGNLLSGLKYHLNIIVWNSHSGSSYIAPTEIELKTFINCLDKYGVLSSIRESRGQDIGAACGQMDGREVIR